MNELNDATLLIVDDDTQNLAFLSRLLQPHYNVVAAPSGERALRITLSEHRPDLILLDVIMPDMDGYTVLKALQDNPVCKDIPIIFVTSLDSPGDEEHGLECGAVDYITKPYRPTIVLARVRTHLELKRARDCLSDQNRYLEAEVTRRMQENDLIQEVSIRALARLAETRDPETGNHILRTQTYVTTLASHLQTTARFNDVLTDHEIEILSRSAALHDIGKVGIPDHILLKPGPLTAEEMAIMQTHAQLGAEAIELAEKDMQRPVEFLKAAKDICHWHHERWDGKGYPDRLSGFAIPLSARIMAVADVFDALITKRVYKEAMSCEKARDIILAERGKQFDPDVTDAFIATFAQFEAIAEKYQD
ncbi:MAG: HD domain-containing phosphohydrolase [Gammaproteobacteria bacterium]